MIESPNHIPGWVEELFVGFMGSGVVTIKGGTRVRCVCRDGWVWISARIEDAVSDPPKIFARRVREAYDSIAERLRAYSGTGDFGSSGGTEGVEGSGGTGGFGGTGGCHAVRYWNFVPGIHHAAGPDLNRYMVFNAGRYAAFESWFGQDPRRDDLLPTASCVGCDASAVVIECLGTTHPFTSVENPRQRPAFHYSQKYGPLPPCFARAAVLPTVPGWDTNPGPMILVAGTASVRGEDSLYIDDLPGQLDETFTNLGCVVRQGCERTEGVTQHPEDHRRSDVDTWLRRFEDLRVYYPRPEHKDQIVDAVKRRMGWVKRVELRRARLCRKELLVEIEGLARGRAVGLEDGPEDVEDRRESVTL